MLDAFAHVYKKLFPSVRPSVRRSVRPSVRHTQVEMYKLPFLTKIAIDDRLKQDSMTKIDYLSDFQVVVLQNSQVKVQCRSTESGNASIYL